MPYAKELTNQVQAQYIPQTTNVAEKETISCHTKGMVPSFPRGHYYPQATQEKVISIPQGISDQEEEEIIIVMEGTPNDILHNPQGFSVTQGMQEKIAYFPQQTQSRHKMISFVFLRDLVWTSNHKKRVSQNSKAH